MSGCWRPCNIVAKRRPLESSWGWPGLAELAVECEGPVSR